MKQRALEKIPVFLEKINRNVEGCIQRTGWAATNDISIADICLLTWISTLIFNDFFKFHYEDIEHYVK